MVSRFFGVSTSPSARWLGLCHPAANPANRLGLPLNVGEHGPAAVLLQPLVDEGPKYHLEAHHTLELARRLAGEDPSPVQQCLGENEHGPCLVPEHRYFPLQRAGPPLIPAELTMNRPPPTRQPTTLALP